jgi:hypothetical protein
MFERFPQSLILAFINGTDVRISSMEAGGIAFETADKLPDERTMLTINLFDVKKYAYNSYHFEDTPVRLEKVGEFSYHYKAVFQGEPPDGFQDALSGVRVAAIFLNDKNMTKDSTQIQPIKAVYPEEKNKDFKSSYNEQLQAWTDGIVDTGKALEPQLSFIESVEWAFSVHNQHMYKHMLDAPLLDDAGFFNTYLEKAGLKGHPYFRRGFQRLYIGNSFCPNLLPNPGTFIRLIEKAVKNGYKVTLEYPYLPEYLVPRLEGMLDQIAQLCRDSGMTIEMTVNDWGVLEVLKKHREVIVPVLGRLLNKRKKDPRFQWKWKPDNAEEAFEENSLNDRWFREALLLDGVERIESEVFPLKSRMTEGAHSLHFPFYQMMTSTYCLMYYKTSKLRRRIEGSYESCEKYCNELVSLYPEHLAAVGIGNSIFGFSGEIMTNAGLARECVSQGVDRFVYTAF